VLVDLQAPDQRRAAGHPGLPRRTGAGQLPGPARHLGPAGGGLDDADRFVMPPGAAALLHRKADLPAALLPGQRPKARRGAAPAAAAVRPARRRLRLLLVQQQPQVHGRGVRRLDAHPAAVPGSVLWLLADNDTARENMLRAADAHGVARQRLIFAPRVAPPEYLARFQLADLMLDTFPFNAGTTASDALWMGTAHRHASRAHLHQPHGRQPAHGGGPARPDHRPPGRLREAGHHAGPRAGGAWPRTSATWPNTAARRRCSTCRRSCATSNRSSSAWPWPPADCGPPGKAAGRDEHQTGPHAAGHGSAAARCAGAHSRLGLDNDALAHALAG
jgi:hypothetical protein